MKNKLLIAFCVALTVLPSDAKSASEFVSEFQRLGYLSSLNCQTHKAMVTPLHWNIFDYQRKQNSTYTIAQYCKDQGGVALIHILNKMDGKELGGIDMWGSFYVK